MIINKISLGSTIERYSSSKTASIKRLKRINPLYIPGENSITYADITIPRCIHVVPCIVRKLRVERINIGDEERKVNRMKSRVKCASFMEIEVV